MFLLVNWFFSSKFLERETERSRIKAYKRIKRYARIWSKISKIQEIQLSFQTNAKSREREVEGKTDLDRERSGGSLEHQLLSEWKQALTTGKAKGRGKRSLPKTKIDIEREREEIWIYLT